MTTKEIDNEIKRINRQITQAAKVFGKDSRLYQQYESILFPRSGTGIGQGLLTRENKSGIIQISRSKRSLQEIADISNYQRGLDQLSRMQTVQQAKEKMIEKYTERTGITVKTAAEKKEAIQAEIENYQTIQAVLADKLHIIYQLEDEMGGLKTVGHTMIEEMSKGHWNSTKELKDMIEVANKTIAGEYSQTEGNLLKMW